MKTLVRCAVAILLAALAGEGMQNVPRPKTTATTVPATNPNVRRLAVSRENNIGVSLMNRQQFEDALRKFRAACAEDPQARVPCLNVGIALENMQRYEEARKALSEFTELDPQNPRAWFNLGLIDRANGQSEAALADFQKVAAIDPRDSDAQYFLGLLYLQQQQYDEARATFRAALQQNPFHVSALFGLAQAEQRSGDVAASAEHLDRFQRMTADKIGSPISFTYGEQGAYSLAESMSPMPEPAPPITPIHFTNVTSVSGLPAVLPVASQNSKNPLTTLAPSFGSGACILDYDGDGKPDIFLVDGDGKGNSALYRNLGNGKFANVTKAAKLDLHGEGEGCAVGDYDNDGKPDFAVSIGSRVLLFHNEGKGVFKNVTEKAGIHMEGLTLGLTFIDYDHDGDLDLYVTRFSNPSATDLTQLSSAPDGGSFPGNVLWRNNGNGTFTDWTKETALSGSAPSIGAIGSDVNNDRAIDFVITGMQKSPQVMLNPREGVFRGTTPWTSSMPAPTAGVVALDFNKDDWMDLAFTHWGAPGLSLWRNVTGTSFERVALPELGWTRGWGIAAFDYDNDGWVDLIAVGEDASGQGHIALLRNEGPAGFRDVSRETGLDKVVLRSPRSLIAFDYDGDGACDLLITQNHLPPVLLKNIGGNRYNWLKLAFQGGHDSKTGIGTKVQLSSGALQQKWEVPGASGYLGQGPSEILAGLGREREADIVRLLWPTGVLQDELQTTARIRRHITEIDRRGSSCPILFVWNGKRYEFLDDIIGPGIVGHWTGPNQRNIPDPDEYFKVAGSKVQIQNGRIHFRMIEPMEEIDYLDQTRLLAVDHPANIEVYPNEYFASSPPFPEFKVIATKDAHTPAGAWDDRGRDVLPLLLERDRKYVEDLPDSPYQGFTGMHTLKIDLGKWDSSRPLRLLMDGFTDYFSANSMYAAWQAGVEPVPPFVEALDSSGKWVRVVNDMGFPAGLPRTIVADLTGKLPPNTRFVRITTNLRIYWDRIRVDNSAPDLPYRITELPLDKADLRFRGYPSVIEGRVRNDIGYVYEDVSPTGPYTRQTGNYTRYGDVLPLLRASDDEYVIFGSGDEVAADFDVTNLPNLPPGWVRDYFFYADGFAKDMDFYADHGDTVAPLPFHTPASYPYPAGIAYPTDERHLKYQLEYNTRGVAGPAGSTYRFEYSGTSRRSGVGKGEN